MATVLLLSGLFHWMLGRLGLPSIISYILAGVVLGPTVLGQAVDLRRLGIKNVGVALSDALVYLELLASRESSDNSVFMFFLGLEVDIRYLRHNLRRSLVLASGGSAVSLVLAAVAGHFIYSLLHQGQGPFLHTAKLYASTTLFMVVMASTASPVLIRIVTELKLSACETGQLAVGAAFATEIACLTTISMINVNPTTFAKDGTLNTPSGRTPIAHLLVFLRIALMLSIAVAVAVCAARLLNRVKRGRRYISNYQLGAMLLLIVGLCIVVQVQGYNGSMAAFLLGLTMPRDGPTARTLIDRLTYPVHQIVLPLYFATVGTELDLVGAGGYSAAQLTAAIVVTTLLSTAGKVGGTMLAGWWLNIRPREALVLGFLLNVKGYSEILAINMGVNTGVWGDTAQVVLLFSSVLSTFMAGPAAAAIVRQQRCASQHRSHCLQDLRVEQELRVLVCVHTAAGVSAMLTMAELCKGSGAPVAVYLLHLVELMASRKYTITQLYKDVNVDNEDQSGYTREMDQVASAVHGFTISDVFMPVRQMTTISNLASMDGDVRNGVQDACASLVIMPYHKEQRYDGRMVCRRDGRRQLNQRILERAPCTVGILIERHLSSSTLASSSTNADPHNNEEESNCDPEAAAMVHNVVVVFLGGPDDREAVAYAMWLAAHPSVSVSVWRFRLTQAAQPEQEKEDEEFMAEVYAWLVETGQVSYTETYVSNRVEVLNTLSAMLGMFSLFVVGRGGGGDAWDIGMLDVEECPDLGPVGELLASDDLYSCSSSVLVLQQHRVQINSKSETTV
ncbi:unnamed protein product [Alopecurus aequalis]